MVTRVNIATWGGIICGQIWAASGQGWWAAVNCVVWLMFAVAVQLVEHRRNITV